MSPATGRGSNVSSSRVATATPPPSSATARAARAIISSELPITIRLYVVGDSRGEGGRAVEAQADHEAVMCSPVLPWRSMTQILATSCSGSSRTSPSSTGSSALPLFVSTWFSTTPNRPDPYPPVLIRRAHLEGLLGYTAVEFHGLEGVVRVLEGGSSATMRPSSATTSPAAMVSETFTFARLLRGG